MQPLRIMTLDLRSPLRYRPSPCADLFGRPPTGERMARFELEGAQATAVEIDTAQYLGSPAVTADSVDASDAAEPSEDEVVIPVGRYLFAQLRPEGARIDADLLAAAALELQKDGLWRAIALEPRFYLRVLAEGDGTVFQILRPIAPSDATENGKRD